MIQIINPRLDASRVTHGLYVGGAPKGLPKAFDTVVFCAEEFQPKLGDPANKLLLYVPLDDHVITPDEKRMALAAGEEVAKRIRLHRDGRVLVTCNMGWNRSALVAGIAMIKSWGTSFEEVIRKIRAARGDMALSNLSFVAYLRELAA